MGAITAGVAVGSYFYVRDVWWEKQDSKFHFEDTPERYALNLDKISHFFGGTVEGDFFAGGFEWTGFDKEKSLLYGALMSNFVSLAVEWTDGYAPSHGFSVKDYAFGVAGAFYPYAQYKIDALRSVNFKWSYWNHVPRFFSTDWNIVPVGEGKFTNEQSKARSFIDNYGNQTYWIVVNAQAVLPSEWRFVPSWLGFAVGARAGDLVPVIGHDKQFTELQIYLSLDIDVPRMLPEEGEFWVVLRRMLSHIHFPAPALRITPRLRVFGFYM